MIKYADMVGSNTVPGEGTYEDYFNEYMNRPHLKAQRLVNRIFSHAFPVAVGGIAGAGAGMLKSTPRTADEYARNGAYIGSGLGLLVSALMYPVIKQKADRLGEEEAWRYAAMRSGKVNLSDHKVLV